MQCTRLTADLSVADLFKCFPETVPVFLRHRMACVGCALMSFESLAGAAAVYGLNLDSFLRELQQVIPTAEERK